MPDVEPEPLTPTDPGPVMVSWAHRPNDGVTAEAWRKTMYQFVGALRSFEINADVDLFHLYEPGVDWSRYGPTRVRESAWTVVAVNAAWRQRFEGSEDPTVGAGAAAEADELLGMFNENREVFRQKVVIVVLPGATTADVPARLSGVHHFEVDEFTEQGMEGLLRILTCQPRYVPPPLGKLPVLPPAVLDSASATVHAAAEQAATGKEISAPVQAKLHNQRAALNAAHQAIADQPRLQQVMAASGQGAQLDSLREAINQALSSSPAFQELQRTTAAAAQKVIASSLANLTNSRGAARAASRLADLLAQVSEVVEEKNSCWVLLAGVFEEAEIEVATEELDGRSVRQRRQEQVSTWVSRTLPPVALSHDLATVALGQDLATVRTTGGVVFSVPTTFPLSPAWHLELRDNGEVVAAAKVTGAVVPGKPFDPPEDGRRQYPDLHLPVHVDLLEMWLLTQVQLAADHLASMAADRGDATVVLQARLLLPDRLSHPQAYPRHGVRLVAATRDEDGHRTPDSAVPGATDLQLGLAPPEAGPLTTTVQALSDPAGLVRTTQSMAVELLEHFGAEETNVLRPDGTLDELAAADQQAVWVHAGALGLVRGSTSPDQRRDRYDELVAQARAALRR